MVVSSLYGLLIPKQQSHAAPESSPGTDRARTRGLRRVVTTHDQSGKAQILSDEEIFGSASPDGRLTGVSIWNTAGVPINNENHQANAASPNLEFCRGSVFRVNELSPDSDAYAPYAFDRLLHVFIRRAGTGPRWRRNCQTNVRVRANTCYCAQGFAKEV
jgi:hypothetical protein